MKSPGVLRLDATVSETEVCLAFKLDVGDGGRNIGGGANADPAAAGGAGGAGAAGAVTHQVPQQQQVFAFLPLRSYGLRFVVQVRSVRSRGDAVYPERFSSTQMLWVW